MNVAPPKYAKITGSCLSAILLLLATVQMRSIHAQTNTDSLYQVAHNPDVPSSSRLLAYRDYILATLYDNTSEALPSLRDYLQLSIQFADSVRIAHAYHCLGFYYRKSGEMLRADTAIGNSLAVARLCGNKYYVVNAYIDQALMLEERGNYRQALLRYTQALDSARIFNEPVMEARAHINLGNLYEIQGDYLLAQDHLQRALSLCEKKKIVGFVASTLLSLGNINATIHNDVEAENYYRKAMEASRQRNNNNTLQQVLMAYARLYTRQENSVAARDMLRQLLQFTITLPNVREQARARYLLANHYLQTAQKDSAIHYLDQALQLLDSFPNTLEKASALVIWGNLNMQEGNYEAAQQHCNEAYSVNRQINDISLQKDACLCLFEVHKQLGQTAQALTYYEEYHRLQQQQTNTPLIKQLLQKQLATALEHRLEMDSLSNAQAVQLINIRHEEELKTQTFRNRIALAAAGILVLVSFVLWRAYRRNRQQKQALEKMDRLNKQVFSIIAHDFKGPLLSMNLLAENLDSQPNYLPNMAGYAADIRHQVAQTSHIIDNLLNWARAELQLNLEENTQAYPEAIANEMIQTFAQKLEAKKLTVHNQLPKETSVNLHPDLLRIVFRNLLSNAIKYSQPGSNITFQYSENTRQIHLADEGMGLSETQQQALFKAPVFSNLGTNHETGFGIGLYITAELLQKRNWQLTVKSKLNAGSTFTLIPENGG